MRTPHLGAILPAALLLAAAAQAQPDAQPGPAADAPTEPALAGPKVRDDLARTLVRTTLQNRLVRIEGRPEAAAIGLLDLTPGQREQARQVVEARNQALRDLLLDELDLVVKATDAIKAGHRDGAQNFYRELSTRLDPANARDPLAGELEGILTGEQRAELTRLLDEYWAAWIEAEVRNAPGRNKPTREAVEVRLKFELFQAEMRAAFETTLRPTQQKLESIYAAVEPTDEQRAALRAAMIDYVRTTRLRHSDEARRVLARRVYEALDEDRRVRLIAAGLAAI